MDSLKEFRDKRLEELKSEYSYKNASEEEKSTLVDDYLYQELDNLTVEEKCDLLRQSDTARGSIEIKIDRTDVNEVLTKILYLSIEKID